MEKQVEQLVSWLREKIEGAGAKGALVGVSGGIDSAVVAYLIKRAFPDNSLGVLLPINKKVEDQPDALAVVENAGLDYIGIELTKAYEETYGTIEGELRNKGEWNEDNAQLRGANLQARLRMSTLYAVAQNYGYLVVGTDNAAEDYTGYFTKYGDGGVDLVPLIHMRKEEVREMAGYLGVTDTVLNKKPSAELWEGQSDEEEMGISYEAIDAYLRGESISMEEEETLSRLHEKSEHKRQIPAGPPEFKEE
ncbi:NAD(+) synthase [Halobacillus sp. A5]|uniref:NAD(+) synthase n=1 Tax=Halobacillus sp. A5 TaxID=2880263 RepID=UPI0020A6840A|nr:NAD(+) synthase [Halobacillus sp. A5]MCP3029035.1 NAD(+) synthase [Halobacillus sp. A5]